ncbi:BQ2448_1957 [Microbotryum intermedium]|uniref:BQ2448_1957 protein n=1 Tax=Microbotryum intermedium TaxID=269621 RepID=A0A238F709_9BASI|nr:BQ2448_1957 [Microbotryum intermedium]
MTHADSLALPPNLSLLEFYRHATSTLQALLATSSPGSGENTLVTCCANASSLLFGLFENYPEKWGTSPGKRVNWCGAFTSIGLIRFYLLPSHLIPHQTTLPSTTSTKLFLGPFHGRPACSFVPLTTRIPGVCASSYLTNSVQLVPNVHERPGHIACDGVTQSEIVLPVHDDKGVVVGVLDLDCEGVDGFGEEDRIGLLGFVDAFERCVDWGSVAEYEKGTQA